MCARALTWGTILERSKGPHWALKGHTLAARAPSSAFFPGAFWALSVNCSGILWAENKSDWSPFAYNQRPLQITPKDGLPLLFDGYYYGRKRNARGAVGAQRVLLGRVGKSARGSIEGHCEGAVRALLGRC